ncbi:MAG: [Lachnospiraceae bacterium]|nr:[FeFe] hydrogenase H-cluster radical SAM maturase HydE [Lachnospiraceae bacterium]
MDERFKNIVDNLKDTHDIDRKDLKYLLTCEGEDNLEYLYETAREVSDSVFHKEVYLRGLIEFTNYCKNNCYYCGIRCGNANADRYRLSEEEILSCCDIGEKIGFKTFVLQGGEDPYFTDDKICDIVRKIKKQHPSCAVTLSIGEKSEESYK